MVVRIFSLWYNIPKENTFHKSSPKRRNRTVPSRKFLGGNITGKEDIDIGKATETTIPQTSSRSYTPCYTWSLLYLSGTAQPSKPKNALNKHFTTKLLKSSFMVLAFQTDLSATTQNSLVFHTMKQLKTKYL